MFMKIFLRLLLLCFLVSANPLVSQTDMFRKERKKTWRKWRKNRQSYNPYLDKKAKNKPSAIMARQDKMELKRQKRGAKKQLRRSRKKTKR